MKRLFILAFLAWLSPPAHADRPRTLLILPFTNATGNPRMDTLRMGLPDLLTASLSEQAGGIRVVEREKLTAVMAEQGLKWENVVRERSVARLGQLLQARFMLRGTVMSMVDHQVRVEWSVYDLETSQLLGARQSTGPASKLALIADQIARDLPAVLDRESVSLPADDDPLTRQSMAQGLAYFHQGLFSKAIPELMSVTSHQPENADARYWLWKSYAAAGLTDDAALEAKTFLARFPKDPRAREFQKGVSKP